MELSPQHRKILSGEARGLGPAALRSLLYALSLPYGLAIRLRNFLYNTGVWPEFRVPRPVLSVGNLTTGGTGKTPAVEFLAAWFAERGARPAILSRGYRARDGRNDEALLLAAHLPGIPHRQQPNRRRAALDAIRLDHANVILLDDGFQHRRLGRFGDILLLDATEPFGYGHLLPRGLLREPVAGIRRADLILITRSDLVPEPDLARLIDRLRRIAPAVPVVTARHAPAAFAIFPDGAPQPPAELARRRVALFSSVGNPAAFRATVERLGAAVQSAAEFPDHHWYTPDDIALITSAANRPVDLFLTTEKDAVKLRNLWPVDRKLAVLRVRIEILSGAPELNKLLEDALRDASRVEKTQA